MDVDAVFFDAGETLVYPHPSFAELFTEVLRAYGHEVDPERAKEIVRASSERLTELFSSEEGRLWSTSPERSWALWNTVYRHFLYGVEVAEEHHERLVKALYDRFGDLDSYRLHPDALPTLERLRAKGITLGVISNFEGWLERLLDALDVGHFFEVTVISGIEGVEKPDPEIFRIALERAKVAPERAVYVGDNPLFDIEPARGAGMFAVLIDRRDHYPDSDAVRITSLEDLPGVIGLDG